MILEVSSRQLTRETVSAMSSNSLVTDIQKGVVAKAQQLQSTIDLLRADEAALTGYPARPRRAYVPVLVISEGFPLNPIIRDAITRQLEDANVLPESSYGRLHIIDVDELEALEAAQRDSKGSVLELLEGHASGRLRNCGLRDHLILNLGYWGRSDRVFQLFDRRLQPTLEMLHVIEAKRARESEEDVDPDPE